MHAHLSIASIAAAMLLLPLAALEASAQRPEPSAQDFQPTRPVYRIERHEADPYREGAGARAGAGAGWGAGAGAGWGAGAGAGMTPSGWRRHSLERYDGYRYSSRDADGDGMPDRWDRHPRNPHRQ